MKITVYFDSGCNARFDADKAVFLTAEQMTANGVIALLRENPGAAIVNADSICFVREVPEESHDE